MRQFNIKALRTIENAAKAAHNERRRRAKIETNFSELTQNDFDQLLMVDKHFEQDVIFHVHGIDLVVKDPILADVLKELSEHQRTIILLKYFLAWTDKQIGELYGAERATIQYRRFSILKKMKKKLGEDDMHELG